MGQHDAGRDRRKYPRIDTEQLISFAQIEAGDRLAVSKNLSVGGICFEVVGCEIALGDVLRLTFNVQDETIIAVTREARAMLCPAEEVNVLSGPGRGVILIKIDGGKDRLLGFIASKGDRDLMVVETSRGAEQTVSTAKYEVTSRGGKGRELLQRGSFTRVVPPPPVVVGPSE